MWRDDECSETGGVAATMWLKEVDDVDVFIGPPCSGCKYLFLSKSKKKNWYMYLALKKCNRNDEHKVIDIFDNLLGTYKLAILSQ